MSAFSKAYAATIIAIYAIIALLDGAPMVLTQLTLADYAAIIGTILRFLLLNLVVYFGIYWLFFRPMCKWQILAF